MSQNSTILIVDDDQNICQILKRILAREGYNTLEANTGEQSINLFKSNAIDVVLLDLQLPDINGIDIAKQMIEINSAAPIIVLSAHSNIDKAVKATKLGVYNFLEKPPDKERILLTLRNALAQNELKQTLNYYKNECLARYRMIGKSEAMNKIYQLIEKVAQFHTPVLILGDNGVGKELVAQALHNGSSRVKRQMVKINCAAIPDHLIESELFGHTKGAFTGAHVAKKGRLEIADGGTAFLDEIGDLSVMAQAKLLRFLENGEIQRVGATDTQKLDVRIIAASNKDIQQMVEEGIFRDDLYFRLNTFPIIISPLKDRKEDIPLLLDFFLDEYTKKYGIIKPHLTPAAINYLSGFNWPGNVRQLRSIVERLIIMKDGTVIDMDAIISVLNEGSQSQLISGNVTKKSLQDARNDFEREYILKILSENNWRVASAAEVLQIDRANLYRKMRQLGIELTM